MFFLSKILKLFSDEDYIRKKFRDVESVNDQTLRGLRWDSAMVRQVIIRCNAIVVIILQVFIELFI